MKVSHHFKHPFTAYVDDGNSVPPKDKSEIEPNPGLIKGIAPSAVKGLEISKKKQRNIIIASVVAGVFATPLLIVGAPIVGLSVFYGASAYQKNKLVKKANKPAPKPAETTAAKTEKTAVKQTSDKVEAKMREFLSANNLTVQQAQDCLDKIAGDKKVPTVGVNTSAKKTPVKTPPPTSISST